MDHSTTVLLNHLMARGKFRHLQVLLKVAELGSVQRAADAIGLTQSSVTQTLAYLERLIDTHLFDRHARGVRPTPACEGLLPLARNVLLALSETAEVIAARQRRGLRLVRLVASVAASHGLLVGTLSEFGKVHPDIAVHLTEAEGDDQLLAVARGEADLVACRRPDVIPEGWLFVPLLEDRFAVLCSAGHRLEGRRRASAELLAEQTWLLFPRNASARTLRRTDALVPQPTTHALGDHALANDGFLAASPRRAAGIDASQLRAAHARSRRAARSRRWAGKAAGTAGAASSVCTAVRSCRAAECLPAESLELNRAGNEPHPPAKC